MNGIDSPKNYVNKLVSLNPDKFEPQPKYVALANYADYIIAFAGSPYLGKENPKSFEDWLNTEI